MWAGGIYLKVRPGNERPYMLLTIGATHDETKKIVAIYDGERESLISWKEVLQDLKKQDL